MTPQEAERAAEHFLRSRGCTHTVRAMRTQFARQDLFACDVLGLTDQGQLWAVQVTTGGSANIAHRRRKLEAIPWPESTEVRVLEVRSKRVGRRTESRFRQHRLRWRWADDDGPAWVVLPEMPVIPPEWRKAWKEAKP